MDTSAVIEKLRALAQKQFDLGNETEGAAIEYDILQLQTWSDGGQSQACPVDLDKYDLKPAGEAPKAKPASQPAVETKPTPAPAVPEPAVQAPPPLPVAPAPTPVEEERTIEELPPVRKDTEATLDELAVEVDSPEQAELRRQLEQARKYYRDGQYREAVALCVQIEQRAADEKLKESAKDLQDQAGSKLKAAVKKALTDGDKARTAGKKEEARKAYQAARALDPENQEAIRLLMELEGGITSKHKLKEDVVQALTSGLKERKDIKRLGESVYEAEAYDKDGKLPSELVDLLAEARKHYDATRIAQGAVTTAMHFENLEGRSKAVKEITDWVATGHKTIYDATTNTDKPAFELLQEAQKTLEAASEDTAEYEINLANKQLPAHPKYAKVRLETALQRPFSDFCRRKLEEKLSEVEGLIQLQDQTEKLINREHGAVEIFRLTTEFYKTFPNSPGRVNQLAQIRQMALSGLVVEVNNLQQQADLNLRMGEYKTARGFESDAQRALALWPEAEKPGELTGLTAGLNELRKRIDLAENDWDEYRKLAKAIREQVVESGRRASALELFKKVNENPRFKSFPDLAILTSEIDNYTDVGEKLINAQAARAEGDWARVFELSEKVIKSGKAGQMEREFRDMYDKAAIEISIGRAKTLIDEDDIPEANNIISAVINKEKGTPRGDELRQRLENELSTIQQCIANNAPMQTQYDRACELIGLRDSVLLKAYVNPTFSLRQARVNLEGVATNPEMRTFINSLKKNPAAADPTTEDLVKLAAPVLRKELARKAVSERLEALRLYRYVGGDVSRSAEAEKNAWRRSLRTAEARRAGRLLVESLRQDVVPSLVRAFESRKEKELSDAVLQRLAEGARGLREAELLESEDEKDAGRWLEVEWFGGREAQTYQERGDYAQAVKIWKILCEAFRSSDIETRWRRVRIQQAVELSKDYLYNHHNNDQAQAILAEVKTEAGIGNSWEVELALAEAYAVIGNFESAFGSLDEAQRFAPDDKRIRTQIQEKRKELEREKEIQSCLAQAQAKKLLSPHDSLRVLQEALGKPATKDSRRLREAREQIFSEASDALLKKVKQELDSGSEEGKLKAITALVDLQGLEDKADVAVSKRQSTKELKRLKSDLGTVADSVIKAGRDFEPASHTLEQAISLGNSISSRLTTFDRVSSQFGQELELVQEKLAKCKRDISKLFDGLVELQKDLVEANNPDLWQAAIRTGDFQTLEKSSRKISALGLNAMQEVQDFEKRLAEWKEIRAFLTREIKEVKDKFTVEEAFEEVKARLTRLVSLPGLRANGQPWQRIQQGDYKEIYDEMGSHLRINDLYKAGELVGWKEVSEAARDRMDEAITWQAWDKECAGKLEDLRSARLATEAHGPDMPHRKKLQDWKKVVTAANELIGLVTAGPHLQGQLVGVNSGKADRIKASNIDRQHLAEEVLADANGKVALLEQNPDIAFPSASEFAEAVKQQDWKRLEGLVARAEAAGAMNDEERMRLKTYKKILADHNNSKTSSILGKLRGK